jgi:hypothetical protein
MYKEGQLIAVNGNIYEYGGIEDADFTKDLKLHKVYVIDIDEEGILTNTCVTEYCTTEELANDTIKLTEKQWFSLVAQLINYHYESNDVRTATEDIVYRCFPTTGLPKIHELEGYIAEYMNR